MRLGIKWTHFAVVAALFCTVAWCGLWGYWWYQSLFIMPAQFSPARIVAVQYLGPDGTLEKRDRVDQAKINDVLLVEINVTHFKSCELEVRRTLQKEGSESSVQLQLAVRSFEGTGIPIVENYHFPIPATAEPGTYVIKNRLRYLCNPVDYLFPLYKFTIPYKIEIVE